MARVHYRSGSLSHLIEKLKDKGYGEFTNIEEVENFIRSTEFPNKEFYKDIYSHLRGAIGEQIAIKELSHLKDTYFVLNDVYIRFSKPVTKRDSGESIKSIQVDHIVVGPTGIYLIETKNWRKESISKADVYSPVQQVQRHSTALFSKLNEAKRKKQIHLTPHHWGERQIRTNNLLLMIDAKPDTRFDFVKVVSTDNLVSHIESQPPEFSDEEVESIANLLINWISQTKLKKLKPRDSYKRTHQVAKTTKQPIKKRTERNLISKRMVQI